MEGMRRRPPVCLRPPSFCSSMSIFSVQPMMGWMPFSAIVIREFERAEEVAGVGDGHRRHVRVLRQHGQRLDLQRAFRQ